MGTISVRTIEGGEESARQHAVPASISVESYSYSGGCKVTLLEDSSSASEHSPKLSIALIQINGQYPKRPLWAFNVRREEVVFVLRGSLVVQQGTRSATLHGGDSFRLVEGVAYRGSGSATAMVIVRDQPEGQTLLLENLKS